MFQAADVWLLRALYAGASNDAWRGVVLAVTFLGSGWMLFGLIPVLFMRSMRTQSTALLVTVGVTSGIVMSVKAIAGRVRPCHALDGIHPLVFAVPTDASFPSGHAAGSFAFAVFILVARPRVGLALLAAATAVAWSRVALGVHYPSDVVAGALLGGMLGFLGARVSSTYGTSRPAILRDPLRGE